MIRNNDMNVAINIIGDRVGSGLGKAQTMAVAHIVDGAITSWEEYEVGWNLLHGQGPEGTHHARIVRFMREHAITAVVTGHMGAPMLNTLTKLGVHPIVNVSGDAREGALTAVDILNS